MISIVIPVEYARLTLLKKTIDKYKEFGIPKDTEFVFVTRTLPERYIRELDIPNYIVITYKFEGPTFNPAMALNIGVSQSKYNNIIITCPEVTPITDVLHQLQYFDGQNVICKVYDEDIDHRQSVLVDKNFRSETPAMYFLAMFNKKDLIDINGWDMKFMAGYAWEDSDFGSRFVRAGKQFIVRDDIQALHQYHPRENINGGWSLNSSLYQDNNNRHVTRCENGLQQVGK